MREGQAAAVVAPAPETSVIDDVDLTLRRLLEDKVPRPRTPFVVRFDQPSDQWEPTAGLNLNVYLYDVRENLELRDPVPRLQVEPDGVAIRRLPPARINLFYVVTAWSGVTQRLEPQVLEEHRLLADVLRTLLSYPTLPRDVLQGSLVGQEPPLPTLVAQMGEGLPHPPAEFWSALQSPMRPSLNLIVTIALQPTSTDPPQRLLPVASEDVSLGPVGGSLYRLSLRPPLRESFEAGVEIRLASLAETSSGHLAAPVRAAADTIDVDNAGAIRANSWLRILDGPNASTSDYVRVSVQTAPGPATLPVEPPLRFPHALGRVVERLGLEVSKTSLAATAAAADTSIEVADRNNLADDDLLMIDDGEQTELVQLTNVVVAVGRGALDVLVPLRFDHDAGRPVRVASIVGVAATLAGAANEDTRAISFAAPDPGLPAGTVVMIGRGGDVEFARLAAPGAPRGVDQPLRRNHPLNAPIRAVTAEEPLGRLVRRAAEGASEAVAGGDRAAELRLGDVVRIGTSAAEPSYHEVTRIRVERGGLADVDRFVHVFGRVVDDTAPSTPVGDATVTLVQSAAGADPEMPLVTTVSAADGTFSFRDIAPGSYLLRILAARYLDHDKPVAVLSTRFDEYVVRLTPN
jgi:Pvc16 N-terminal domain/Carboxypeptidase regulatory-like domain